MREDHLFGDVQICRAGLGFKIPGLEHPDAPGLDLLASVLGVGHSSILWQNLRDEKKLVHHIDASCWNPGYGGLFWISYTCDEGKRAAAQEAILEEIQKLIRDRVDEKRLQKAIRQTLIGEINARKTMSDQASRLGLAEVVVGDLAYPRQYYRKLYKVGLADLPNLARDYLKSEGLTAVSLNPMPAKRPTQSETKASPRHSRF